MNGPRTVSTSIVFAEPIAADRSTLHVRVEDTSRADAAAHVVAETVEPLTGPVAAGERLTVRLTVPQVDEHARYSVRVHVDCSGSGEVSPGDRITTRTYPVLTQGAPDDVEVEVVEI